LERSTEKDSSYRNLERMSTIDLLQNINKEDQLVAIAVERVLPRIETLVDALYLKMQMGGRLFYIGSGTSGRLGILDASECPPTYGIGFDIVVGIIAGGDKAIRIAQEGAEDDLKQAWLDLKEYNITNNDFVIGISASGTTPYVLAGLKACRDNGVSTACICCNDNSPISAFSDYPVEVITGPEFVTGSTRMKAGTAQKLVLNMITTTVMIKLGKVMDNKMVDMRLSNDKLVERGTRMLMNLYKWKYEDAKNLLLKYGSVRKVIEKTGGEGTNASDRTIL
jgi:N-acetylmuramic acid 6-phosphate etherase